MPRKQEITVEEFAPCFTLDPGFYLLDENRCLKTKTVTQGKRGEERQTVTIPIRCRTIQGAKDVVLASGSPLAILCVTGDGMTWPCN